MRNEKELTEREKYEISVVQDLFERRKQVFDEKIGKRLARVSFSSFEDFEAKTDEQAHALKACGLFAERFIERVSLTAKAKACTGLLLLGNYGTGKTLLATAILRQIRHGAYVRFADMYDLIIDHAADLPTSEVIRRLTEISCLVIDEIGVSSWTDAERKRLYQIVDGRLSNGLPTILVSNLVGKELANCIGGRLVSRMTSSMYPVLFNWEDHRLSQAPKSAEDAFSF